MTVAQMNLTTDYLLEKFDTTRNVLTLISSLFSAVGASTIIVSFLLLRNVRSLSRSIVVIMAIADISVAVPSFISACAVVSMGEINSVTNGTFCEIQSLVMTTGTQLSFIWTAGLAQHMYILVQFRPDLIKKAMSCLVFLTLAVFAENGILFNQDILGRGNVTAGFNWCWIKMENGTSDCLYMIWDGKLLEIMMYVVVLTYYTLLYIRVKNIQDREDVIANSVTSVLAKTGKIIAIPIVFVLVRLSGTIVSLWFVAGSCALPQHPLYFCFLVLTSVFDVSQGWINFILYVLTTSPELKIGERVKIAVRSIPYVAGRRIRVHSSQNSCLTYNTSRNCGGTTSNNSSNKPFPAGGLQEDAEHGVINDSDPAVN